jgi:putative ABC transport system permease protein
VTSKTAFKIAWRESRASSTKFIFVILAVAAGVGSLTGVRGFSRGFRDMLLKDARTLMAGDLSVRVFEMPNAEQNALFASLQARGVKRTWITETVSMMASVSSPDPVLVAVKAVEPGIYPFYGAVKLEPEATLQSSLRDDTVAVSDDLLPRLQVKIGDAVKLGGQEFRIVRTVVSEPDRMAGSLNIGPRILLSRAALERSGLLLPGSRSAQRYLFKLPPEMKTVEAVRAELKRAFPDSVIADYTETHPLITRGLDRATMFLSLVSLIAMIVGAIGVATAIHSHLQQKMDSIAVMKSIGGRSSQIIGIYSIQALMLALTGSVIGLAIGLAVERAFPLLIAQYFPVHPDLHWHWSAAVEGLLVGGLSTMLFTLPPLLGIRRIRPNLILRREMEESKPRGMERLRNLAVPAAAGVLILLGLGGIATWLVFGLIGKNPSDAFRVGGYFVGGLTVAILALTAFAWLLLRGLRILVRLLGHTLPSTIRHGIANLYRPGNQAEAVLVSLGLGVMFTLTIYLVQHSVLAQISRSAPPSMPNVFLINITERESSAVLAALKSAKGIQGNPEVLPAANAKLIAVNGELIQDKFKEGPGRRFRQPRGARWSAVVPDHTDIVKGAWWKTYDKNSPQVAVAEEAAKILGIEPGAQLEWSIAGRKFTTPVAAVYRTETVRAGMAFEFIFTPGVFDGVPVLYFGGVRMDSSQIAALQRDFYMRFPAITVINIADVLDRVQEVVDQIAIVVRFISAFAIFAGAIILASSVAGTRFRRVREVVILKTIGATRRRVSGIFLVEFLLLGAVSGVMGSMLASGFSWLLLKRLLDSEFRFDIVPNVVAVLLTALIATGTGWLASYRILRQKPLEVLRDE